jgi:mRNA interferase MazF
MIRGEIWSVLLPIGTGREQGGQRPAIVVQDAFYGQLSPLVLIVPLTSQLSATRFSATVQIVPSSQNGLTLPSVALVFQTRATDRSRFVQRLGVLSSPDLSAVLEQLNKLTGQ